MQNDVLGKHGSHRPKTTIDGGVVQNHFHKRGIGNGYYVIVPMKSPSNLDELLEQAKALAESLESKSKPKTKGKAIDES